MLAMRIPVGAFALIFTPTLDHYREVLFGASSILPNLWSSLVVTVSTTVLTLLFAVPAAYAVARLRYPGKRASGFYVLATQMLPPVGLIIPYYLALQRVGGYDGHGAPNAPIRMAWQAQAAAGG